MKLIANTGRFALPRWIFLVVLMGLCHGPGRVSAQEDFGADLFPDFSLGGFGKSAEEEPSTWSARYHIDASGAGRLEVEASLSPTWHIYSTTQKPGGPTRTTLQVIEPKDVRVTGPFVPDQEPSKSVSSLYNGLTVEEHEKRVIWSAPFSAPPGFDQPLTVSVKALVCKVGGDNRCMPVREQLTATKVDPQTASALPADPTSADPTSADPTRVQADLGKPFQDGDYVVQWFASLIPSTLAPGQTGVLRFVAKPEADFHVYKAVVNDADSSTNFVVTQKSGLLFGQPIADKSFVTHSPLANLKVSYYKGDVVWQIPVKIPAGTPLGEKRIEGMIGYQACTDTSCLRPMALKFTGKLLVSETSNRAIAPVDMVTARRADALDAAAMTNWVDAVNLSDVTAATPPGQVVTESQDTRNGDQSIGEQVTSQEASTPPTPGNRSVQTNVTGDQQATTATPVTSGTDQSDSGDGGATVGDPAKATSFPIILGLAFLGGLILNVMPCVLPVVGLKIMGFVKQAGEDQNRILVLNLVYVLGIMSVFAVFAVGAAVSKLGWGEHFTFFPLRFGLTVGLFALALSYLGVWEIPAPGMAGGKTSQDLQNREGLAGAFSKGVFATILATPCSGPMLGYILGLTLDLSPAHTIAILLTVGLGMSFPYLVIGMRPSLVTWLPKPGPWMETVKQLMAFLFLGTVAFFFAQFSDEQKVPVFVSLIAVWFGCWIVGQVPNWAELQKRLLALFVGVTTATLISVWAFSALKPDKTLAWEDYSEPRLQQLQKEGRTVMVDFGAKWCGTCIYNYEVAINTAETRKVIDELDAVALYADWTDYSPEIKQKLDELNSRSIPLLAIYPGSRPNEPIILRDIVTQNAVVEALRQAGASVGTSANLVDSRQSVIASTSR